MWKIIFLHNMAFRRLILVNGTSCEFESWDNCQARLYFLSCSAPAVVTFQLFACFTRVAFWRVISRKIQSRESSNAHTLEFYHTLSHTQPLHNFHLNTRHLIAKIQKIWHGIKPTHDWINSTLQKIYRNKL